MSSEVAVGLVPQTGWTWLVRVRGTARAASVELRVRVAAATAAFLAAGRQAVGAPWGAR